MYRSLLFSTTWLVVIFSLVALISTPAMSQPDRQRDRNRVTLGESAIEWRDGVAAGTMNAEIVAPACLGYISSVPDFVLEVRTDSYVRITVSTRGHHVDATLILTGAEQTWCNDDLSEDDTDPEINTFLLAGEYFVYVGRSDAESGGEYEIRFMTESSAPAMTIGRRTQQFQLTGMSGNEIMANTRLADCPGAIPMGPSHVFHLRRPMYLDLVADSSADLVLLVASDRGVVCSDDAVGTLNPHVMDWFSRGFIRVYVGSHNPNVSSPYILTVQPVVTSN